MSDLSDLMEQDSGLNQLLTKEDDLEQTGTENTSFLIICQYKI